MQKGLLIKAAFIVTLFALLQIPLRMIDGIVGERAARQQAVVREIASSSYGPQLFAGPVLSLPYVEQFDETVIDGRSRRVERRSIERVARVFASASAIEATAVIETKTRGLFAVRVFQWHAVARGEFVFDRSLEIQRSRSDSRLTFGRPTLNVVLGDPRGLVGGPSLEWNGTPLAFERGSGLDRAANGVHADIPPFDPAQPQRFGYAIDVTLHGTESLSIVPLADDDRTGLRSRWQHPSFGGQFLPLPESGQRRADGFDARWNVTSLASNAQQQVLAQLDGRTACQQSLCADRLDVRFIDPIDIYSLSDRALKYGFLFIGLTFACFALFEVLNALRIHPAQYLLVGLALATFFLLLIALSEHVAFPIAYAIASLACVALLGYYLSGVLGGARLGASFASLFALLFGALYGLLVSEDNALLLGSILVFVLLAAAMVLTRRLDWYASRPKPHAGG
jgi:inner membrane protein